MKKRMMFFVLFVVFFENSFSKDFHTIQKFKDAVYGIDVSRHQGNIDWSGVKNSNNRNIDFVYIKATEGATLQDVKYKENVNGARKHKILLGSYHYFKTKSSPDNQFQNFIKMVDKKNQDLVPMVDVEEKKGCDDRTFHKNLKKFLSLVESHFNKKPIIYTSNSFYNNYLHGKYKDYKFFLGRYSDQTPKIRDGHSWTLWQFSEKGIVNGVPRKVDLNILNPKFQLCDLFISQ